MGIQCHCYHTHVFVNSIRRIEAYERKVKPSNFWGASCMLRNALEVEIITALRNACRDPGKEDYVSTMKQDLVFFPVYTIQLSSFPDLEIQN